MSDSKKGVKNGSKVAKSVRHQSEKAPHQTAHTPSGANGRRPVTTENNTLDPLGPSEVAEQYPTAFLTDHDKRDEKYRLLEELRADAGSSDTEYGRIAWSDDVVEYLKKKKQAGIKAKFEGWFIENFDKMSPTAKALARDLYPNLYRERLKTLKMNVKLLEQLAAIRIRGVQTKSDLYLQYAADEGLIDLSNIRHILHPEEAGLEKRQQQYKRGMFNPRRYVFGDSGVDGSLQNMEDFHGRLSDTATQIDHPGLLSGLARQQEGYEGSQTAGSLRTWLNGL